MTSHSRKAPRTQKLHKKTEKGRNSKVQTGSFRVIGGTWRSRRLTFPAIVGLRPTTDRVKETVFNWLSAYLPDANVLDLFAGSGSLGIEALSRGAKSVTFIEKDKQAAIAIRENFKLLGIQENIETKVLNIDALTWLSSWDNANTSKAFDVIFIDPPFRKGLLNDCLSYLEQNHRLDKGTMVYLEREKEAIETCIPKSWTLLKEKVAGQVSYQLFKM